MIRNLIIIFLMMTTMTHTVNAQSQHNPWGLVYTDALAKNEPGKVNLTPVSYHIGNLKVVANVYTPAGYDKKKSYPAIVVAHPNGGVKEQVAGKYAQLLAEQGFITIAFDAAYQGGSEGEPRQTDRPQNRMEDIRCAGDFIASFPGVDKERIGVFGICGGGGYTLKTAQTDKRFKAVATLSMFNSGVVRLNGFMNTDIARIPQKLKEATLAREAEIATGKPEYIGDMSGITPEQAKKLPFELYRDGYEYYLQSHAHPNSTFRYTKSSLIDLYAFNAADGMELIDQPLLMIAGQNADTFYMTAECYARATGTKDKELFLVPGASHIRTYFVPEYVNLIASKLTAFFSNKL